MRRRSLLGSAAAAAASLLAGCAGDGGADATSTTTTAGDATTATTGPSVTTATTTATDATTETTTRTTTTSATTTTGTTTTTSTTATTTAQEFVEVSPEKPDGDGVATHGEYYYNVRQFLGRRPELGQVTRLRVSPDGDRYVLRFRSAVSEVDLSQLRIDGTFFREVVALSTLYGEYVESQPEVAPDRMTFEVYDAAGNHEADLTVRRAWVERYAGGANDAIWLAGKVIRESRE